MIIFYPNKDNIIFVSWVNTIMYLDLTKKPNIQHIKNFN